MVNKKAFIHGTITILERKLNERETVQAFKLKWSQSKDIQNK